MIRFFVTGYLLETSSWWLGRRKKECLPTVLGNGNPGSIKLRWWLEITFPVKQLLLNILPRNILAGR